jgi:hypothetical protein
MISHNTLYDLNAPTQHAVSAQSLIHLAEDAPPFTGGLTVCVRIQANTGRGSMFRHAFRCVIGQGWCLAKSLISLSRRPSGIHCS